MSNGFRDSIELLVRDEMCANPNLEETCKGTITLFLHKHFLSDFVLKICKALEMVDFGADSGRNSQISVDIFAVFKCPSLPSIQINIFISGFIYSILGIQYMQFNMTTRASITITFCLYKIKLISRQHIFTAQPFLLKLISSLVVKPVVTR